MWSKFLIVAAIVALTSCGGYTKKKVAEILGPPAVDMHTAANSLDYTGIYSGTIPAADCPGIEVRLVLYTDGNYQQNMEYIERDTGFDEQGTYTLNGNILMLAPSKAGDRPSFYKVEEGQLRMLDGDMQVIEGPLANNYILKKAQ